MIDGLIVQYIGFWWSKDKGEKNNLYFETLKIQIKIRIKDEDT